MCFGFIWETSLFQVAHYIDMNVKYGGSKLQASTETLFIHTYVYIHFSGGICKLFCIWIDTGRLNLRSSFILGKLYHARLYQILGYGAFFER